jgi:CheY-like chemotaxis protein
MKRLILILVVDDESAIRSPLQRLLEKGLSTAEVKIEVSCAGDVMEAKGILSGFVFDLILTDVSMPGGTGLDLLQFVKESPAHKETPVCLMSGRFGNYTDDPRVGQSAAVFQKPFQHGCKDLIETIAALLRISPENQESGDKTT